MQTGTNKPASGESESTWSSRIGSRTIVRYECVNPYKRCHFPAFGSNCPDCERITLKNVPTPKQLATLLVDHIWSKVDDRHFDIEFYWHEERCGAVGCVVGHAGQIPQFQRLGLVAPLDGLPQIRGTRANFTGVDVMQPLLEISRAECTRLFQGRSYHTEDSDGKWIPPGRRVVIERICQTMDIETPWERGVKDIES